MCLRAGVAHSGGPIVRIGATCGQFPWQMNCSIEPGFQRGLVKFCKQARIIVALTFALAAAAAAPVTAWAGPDAVGISALKAAFLVNFAKFAAWPSDALAPGQRLTLCVIGDDAVAEALHLTIRGRAVEGHEMTVHVAKHGGPLRSCHLLYVSGLDDKQAVELLESVRPAPVFTVSDHEHFAVSGGVAQLIVEKDRMHFAINLKSAARSRLILSSKLLSLARIVKDES